MRCFCIHGLLSTCLCGILAAVAAGCKKPAADADSSLNAPGAGSAAADAHPSGSRTGGEGPSDVQGIRFADRTESAGVRFSYRNDEEAEHYAILESLGGGVALVDFDRDGLLDLFAPGGGEYIGPEQMTGRSPLLCRAVSLWRYRDVTEAGFAQSAPWYSHGVAAADYDNDGFCDMLVTGYGGVLLLHNEGDGTFRERASDARLIDPSWSSSAAWLDADRDGALDVYVAHYVNWSFENHPLCPGPRPGEKEVCPPRRYEPLPDSLFLSGGDGTFSESSAAAGLRDDGKGLGVVAADVDLDGDQDIYVGNDTVPNFLYRNEGNGTFTDVSLLSGTSLSDEGTPDGSMGVEVGDFDLDGRPDIWVANYERESFALYRNLGDSFFRHVSRPTGIMAAAGLYVGWGTVFADFDHDADEDIFVSNGHVIRHPTNAPLLQKALLFRNDEGRRFVNVTDAAGDYVAEPHMGRGVAGGDLDNDGDTDLVLTPTNEPLTLLENTSTGDSHWLQLRLIGRASNRDAMGAVVTLIPTSGPRQMRQIKGGGSYASTGDRRLQFGLGPHDQPVSLSIRWPSGIEQQVTDVGVDQELLMMEPAG